MQGKENMQLSEGQRLQYKEDGYTVVRGLISPAEVAQAQALARLMDLHAGNLEWPDEHFQVLDPDRFRAAQGGGHGVCRSQPRIALSDDSGSPRFQSVMAQLLEGPVERYTESWVE